MSNRKSKIKRHNKNDPMTLNAENAARNLPCFLTPLTVLFVEKNWSQDER